MIFNKDSRISKIKLKTPWSSLRYYLRGPPVENLNEYKVSVYGSITCFSSAVEINDQASLHRFRSD